MIRHGIKKTVCCILAGLPLMVKATTWSQWAVDGTYAIQYVGEQAHVDGCYLANPLVLGGQDWSDIMLVDSYDDKASAWNIHDEGGGNVSIRNTQGGKNEGDLIIYKSQIRTSNNANFVTYLKNQTFRIYASDESEDGLINCTVLSNYENGRFWAPSSITKTLSFDTNTQENASRFRLIPLYNYEVMVSWLHACDSILGDVEKSYAEEKRVELKNQRDGMAYLLSRLDNTKEKTEQALLSMQKAFEDFEASGTSGPVSDLSGLTAYERAYKTSLVVTGNMTLEDFRIIRGEMYRLRSLDLSGAEFAELPERAFAGCEALEHVKLPASCTKIGDGAFLSCTALSESPLTEQITEIGHLAFSHSGLKTVSISANVTRLGQYVFEGCKSLESITVDPANNYYLSEDGVLYDKELSTLIKCPEAKAGKLALPETLKTVAAYACTNCTQLTGELILPVGVTVLGNHAFSNCPGLTGSLAIPESLYEMGDGAFWGCYGFAKDLALPDGLQSIGMNTFGYLSQIEKIVLPTSLGVLREGVFNNCLGVRHIVSSRGTPPAVEDFAFYGIDREQTYIEVPEDAKEVYLSAEVWKDFLNYDKVMAPPVRWSESGRYYIQFVGEGKNKNKFVGFSAKNGGKAPLVSVDQAALWELDFFNVTSSTSPVQGGMGCDIRYADGAVYRHINMDADCYTDNIAGYNINDNRSFAFWMQNDDGRPYQLVAIQGNNTYWNADSNEAVLVAENYKSMPRLQDFVFRLIAEEEMTDAFKVGLLKSSLDASAYRDYVEGITVGTDTWQLPEADRSLKTDLVAAIDAFEGLKDSDVTDYATFEQQVEQNKMQVENGIQRIEQAILRPQLYEMPIGLCFNLIRSGDGKMLMRSGSAQWKQFCTSFEEEGTIVTIGENSNGVPEKIEVSPALFMNKWDAVNENYYLYEVMAANALRLNDGFLAQSLPNGTNYASKARIVAYHQATDQTFNIQGAPGGYTNGAYFSGQIRMEEDERKATCWQLNVVKRVIAPGEAWETLEDVSVPVEMYENAQMTGAEEKRFDRLTFVKELKADRWYAISLPDEARMLLQDDIEGHEKGDTLRPVTDVELMTYVAGRFCRLQASDDGTVPAGTYVVKVATDMQIAFRMEQVQFVDAETDDDDNMIFKGTGIVVNKENVNAYTLNEEGTAFVYAPQQTIKPFEGYITSNGTGDFAPIVISEATTGIPELTSAVSFYVKGHRLYVSGTDDYELAQLSGVRVRDKKGVQIPGVYVLTLQGKSFKIRL